MIFHISQRAHWEAAQQIGLYRVESLDTDGFIHFSDQDQVIPVANRFYRDQTDLVLLCVNPLALQSELRYEAIETGEQFPHLYGELNVDAVTQVYPLPASADGTFILPEDLQS